MYIIHFYTVELIILMNAVQLFKMKGENRLFFFRETSNLSRVFVDFHSLWGHPMRPIYKLLWNKNVRCWLG